MVWKSYHTEGARMIPLDRSDCLHYEWMNGTISCLLLFIFLLLLLVFVFVDICVMLYLDEENMNRLSDITQRTSSSVSWLPARSPLVISPRSAAHCRPRGIVSEQHCAGLTGWAEPQLQSAQIHQHGDTTSRKKAPRKRTGSAWGQRRQPSLQRHTAANQ